ncbi:MAG TPA: Flp family type IVb pilin [Candidatus Dormibacteraeota bacterium]|nr:Flp family type IVb pilin [Candidatus Dormibacteraeota bacterium]
MPRQIRSLLADDSGATLVEYGLLLALVAMAAMVSMKTLGTHISTLFTSAANKL